MLVRDYIGRWETSLFRQDLTPWQITKRAPELVRQAIGDLGSDYRRIGEAAVHITAEVEPGATLKGPVIVGPRCFVAAWALLRGGVFLDDDCIVGPAVELKTTFMFKGSKAAHLNFIGDSLVGADVNFEAGSIVANYRNELEDKAIRIFLKGDVIDTGVEKFGALVGDGSRIGANAVIAPGAALEPRTRVPRLGLIDQHPLNAMRWRADGDD